MNPNQDPDFITPRRPVTAGTSTPAPAPGAVYNPATPGSDSPGPSHLPPVKINEPYVSSPGTHETLREIISTIGVLVAALLVAFGLIAWVFQSYEVDGPSMQTTLMNHDRLIVWKVPRTIARIAHKDYVPHRGDIIIFVESGLSQFGQDNDKQLIKRVIGLPGERIVLSNGVLTVYNRDHPDGFQPDKTMSYGSVINETLDEHTLDITLAKDQLFVCGDNRPDSLDSRTFGPIEAHQIVGKLSLRLLPLKNLQKF